MTKLIAFAGSARKDSINKKLAAYAAQLAQQEGAQVTVVDLADYPMPIYDGDLETASGKPEHAARLKKLFIEADGFIIASPEYNSSFSPLLKNVIDWISRTDGDEAPLVAFRGKSTLLLAASPGGYGGLRGLVHVRAVLGNIGVHVYPDQVAIPAADKAFDTQGLLNEGPSKSMLARTVKGYVESAKRLAASA